MTSASEEELKEDFLDTVSPQKQMGGFTVRLSTKAHLTAALKALTVKPILMYSEEWCEYHEGWHVYLTRPKESTPKCYEGEMFRRGEIKKAEKKPNQRFEFVL